ncbi:uncharacterized protein AC631_05320 [Debaryomyces fabryi]|uniref:RGS domain-containing protein n=1 Tax=Debaryomyces fabryi TaxID=58627 RepID=A0A0V1PRP5_9ASCO|nr:uncharacterized protein AC631_05320 [Debaryomyces fabryi]KRZ98917.1 hypothetical protein AC631_05320 [Debaryomyces fabryi]CUM46398.1 unnamed protein product [Debaryomyces fabryi]
MKIKNILNINTSGDSSKTLHETVLKNFNKTPSGKIYENELKDIYSMMLICLELKEIQGVRMKLNPLAKSHPYSFHIEEALEKMKHLEVKIELSKTTTTISYSIKPDLGSALLSKFFNAKLLHSPADRTRSMPKNGVLLQPTPKGVAILQDFYKKIGGKKESIPPILLSSLNSMDLFKFDRDPISDKILYSDYFLQLIFVKLVSNTPNIWSPNKKPDPLPSIDSKLDLNECFTDGFDFSMLGIDRTTVNLQNLYPGCEGVNFWDSQSNGSNISTEGRDKKYCLISPIHHTYFTNPESDSHVQYYVSNTGVRFHQDMVFRSTAGEDVIVNLCISGKAICQWLCDCTDVISVHHATEIADLLLKVKLLTPITLYPSNANHKRFQSDRFSFYILSNQGLNIAHWTDINQNELFNNIEEIPTERLTYKELSSQSVESFIDNCEARDPRSQISQKIPITTLQDNLKDPGMRYLFKKHLEKEFCSENLEAYLQLKQFHKKITILSQLLIFKRSCMKQVTRSIDCQIIQLANTCLGMAYHIYFSYLSSDSPFLLNINYNLKEKITRIMLNKSMISSAPTQDYTKTPIQENSGDDSEPQSIADDMDLGCSPKSTSPVTSIKLPTSNNKARITGDSNIKRQDIVYEEFDFQFKSPMEQNIRNTLNILVQVSEIFEATANHIYRLMEVDSFPKFLDSDIYRRATSYIELRK